MELDWGIMSNIIIAGLSLVGTMIGAFLANSKTTALIAYRIESLEKKVEKHNTIVERTYKLENDMSTVWKRYDDLKDIVIHDHENDNKGA